MYQFLLVGSNSDWLNIASFDQSTLSNDDTTQSLASNSYQHPSCLPVDDLGPPVASTSSSEWASDDSDSHRHSKKKRKKKKKKKERHKSKRKHREKEKHSTKISEAKLSKPDTIWLDEVCLDPPDAYRFDKRSDKANLDFDSLYRLDVASYKQRDKWVCLGSARKNVIFLNERRSRKRAREIREQERLFRYFRPQDMNTDEIEEESNRFVHGIECEDFLPICSRRHMKTNSDDEGSDVESPSFASDSFRAKSRRLRDYLQSNPHNVEVWIEFAELQNEVVFDDQDDISRDSKVNQRAINEKKESIIEKAMVKNHGSVELLRYYMKLLLDLKSREEVVEKWKDVLFRFPHRSALWADYLISLQSDVTNMTVSSVVDQYERCFTMLAGILEGSVRSHTPEDNALMGLVRTLVQYVLFLWQAGMFLVSSVIYTCNRCISFNRSCNWV